MYLSKLELVGFKSFPKKTGLKFNDGVTAIVGPNGCGKSNIIDAIRWVIGEQRASVLRSDKMENVIFNGTGSRRPLSMAEVSLTIENTRGILPTEYSEVTISRRLFRNGDSEYLLNKTQCRLKDIVELFMDTGMGANAYSVIELKMIETILSDRSGDRRMLFEEAAGVTRYKQRRKEALRKLDATRSDLERVEDIVREVDKKVRSLERQAKKAEEYARLESHREQLEIALLQREYRGAIDRIVPLEAKLAEARKNRSELDEQLAREEIALAELEREQAEIESQLAEANRDLAEVTERIATVERQRAVAVERRTGLEGAISRANREIDEAKGAIEALAADREEVEANRREIARQRAEAQVAFDEIASRVDVEGTRLNAEKQKARAAQEEVVGVLNRLADLRGEEERVRARVEGIEERLARFDREDAELASTRSETIDEIAAIDERIDQLSAILDRARNDFAEGEQSKRSLRSEIETIDESLAALRDRRASVRTSLEFLESLVSDDDAVEYLTEVASGRGESLQTVGDVIVVPDDLRAAVAAALGDAAGWIIAQDRSAALASLARLRADEKGRATFVCLDSVPPETRRTRSDLPSVSSLVASDPKFDPLVDYLLGDVYLVDSIPEDAESLRGPGRVVTQDGLAAAGGPVIAGGDRSVGSIDSIGRLERIERLRGELEQLDSTVDELAKRRSEVSASESAIDLGRLSGILSEAQSELAAADQDRSGLEYRRTNAEEVLAEHAEDRSAASGDLARLNELLDGIAPRREALDAEKRKREDETEQLGRIVEELEEAFSQLTEELGARKVELVELEGEQKSATTELERIERDRRAANATISRAEREIEEARQEFETTGNSLTEFTERLEAFRAEQEQVRDNHRKISDLQSRKRAEISDHTERVRSERRGLESSVELAHELEVKIGELRTKAEGFRERGQEEFGIEIGQIEPEAADDSDEVEAAEETAQNDHPGMELSNGQASGADSGIEADEPIIPESTTELREELRSTKGRLKMLGNVNLLAWEEYESEWERFEFLTVQVSDLREAERDLVETIDEINETAQRKFGETFEQIRENFRSLFGYLFEEGDEADLVIEEDADDLLEARIEIVAKPRNKRPHSIDLLSGGEKTLTAIALLFAIYLVKPSPFCILDEVDAPLDDANIDRFVRLIRRFDAETQFIIVTHNKRTMVAADTVFGVTQQETGVSEILHHAFIEPQGSKESAVNGSPATESIDS